MNRAAMRAHIYGRQIGLPTLFLQGQISAEKLVATDGLDFMQKKMASQTELKNIILIEKKG